jgi:4'-phosphopantetheinyl transferase
VRIVLRDFEPFAAEGDARAIAAEEIHLWRVDLTLQGGQIDALRACLTDPERERAVRLRATGREAECIAARGCLRHLLAAYLETDAVDLTFVPAPGGKPVLASDPSLRFSFSDSGGRALVAVARDREIGVDVERIRERKLRPGLMERVMSPAERAMAERCESQGALHLFYRLWARKEAVLKAAGVGLRMRPARVDVLDTGSPVAVPFGDAGETAWRVRDVEAGEGWAAAVAWEAE